MKLHLLTTGVTHLQLTHHIAFRKVHLNAVQMFKCFIDSLDVGFTHLVFTLPKEHCHEKMNFHITKL